MLLLLAILNVVSIIVQILVTYYTYSLYKLIRPLKAWTLAWGLFGVSMAVVGLRRIWSLGLFLDETNWLKGVCPKNVDVYFIEIMLLLVVSVLWVVFVYSLKNIFSKYLGPHSGDSVLVDREQTVEHREVTVGKREVEVQSREDKQKRSSYYEDPENLNRKIVNGK